MEEVLFMKKSVWFLIVFLFLSAFPALGQVDVRVGQGKVEISDPDWPLSHSVKRDLETRLMVRPEFADVVTAEDMVLISLPEDYLQPLQDELESKLPGVEDRLVELINASIERQDYAKVPDRNWDEGMVLDEDDGAKRVVMGANEKVGPEENIRELVVIGGKVDVQGQVESLVIIGGFVVLMPGSRVTRELVIVGGHLEEQEGSSISGKRVDMSMPGGEEAWTILRDKIKKQLFQEMKDHSWIRFFGFFLKLAILMLFFWLGDFLAPSYQREVESYLQRKPGWSAFWGFLSALLVLPVTLFLTLSLIGIPLLPLQFSLLFVFVIYGEIHIAKYLVGLVPLFRERLQLATFLGLVAIEAIGLLAGFQLIKWAIIIVGFGAASKVFYGRVFRPSSL